jgi:hypothetical protein
MRRSTISAASVSTATARNTGEGMKVLAVDGPLRGRVYTVTKGTHFLYHDMPPLASLEGEIKALVYNVHRYVLINRVILLASLCNLADEISTEDVWEAIVSDRAKDAVAYAVPETA